MTIRIIQFAGLLIASWFVMTFTHEVGHIVGGLCCGGTLSEADLLPWHLPYSFFDPDPFPRITLWSGPILGVVFPLAGAFIFRRDWVWLIAYFCLLANGAYLGVAWFSPADQLDTTKLLNHGVHPSAIFLYSAITICAGYIGFRRQCIRFFQTKNPVVEQSPR